MADQHDVDLDSIIDRLLEVRGSRPGKQVQLLETEIRYLCTKAREIFISQPILLELEAPIKVCKSPVHNTMDPPSCGNRNRTTDIFLLFLLHRSAVISTVNIMISYASSSMVASHLRQTTSSLATT